MKAMTICQPYAAAIVHGPKRVENRAQPWRFRGRLLVHAGQSRKWMGTMNALELADWPTYDEAALVFGALIGSVEVFDCVELRRASRDDVWASGPFCLLLRDPIAFRQPIPWRGALGLFDVPIPLPRRDEPADR